MLLGKSHPHFTDEEVKAQSQRQNLKIQSGEAREGTAVWPLRDIESSRKRALSLNVCLLVEYRHRGLRKWAGGTREGGGLCPFLQNSPALRENGSTLHPAGSQPQPNGTLPLPPAPMWAAPGLQPFPQPAWEGQGGRQAQLTCQGWQLGMQMGVGQRLNAPGEGSRRLAEARKGQAGRWGHAPRVPSVSPAL